MREMMRIGVLARALAITMWIGACAHADRIVLSDGRYLDGEVLEETTTDISFRYQLAGIWTTQKFLKRDVDVIERKDGDQSDLGQAQDDDKTHVAHKPGVTNPTTDLPKVVIIPLHGVVGLVDSDSIGNSFDATELQQCLERAHELNAEAVLLEIDSPGGLVSEMERICETIIAWKGTLRIVAYPKDAFSAAAVISLSCPELVMHKKSRVGAAVIIIKKGGKTSAVDAKMASPHYAKQKQYMASSGQPYELLSAMTIMETELWWSEQGGFRNAQPQGNEWSVVDGATTVLTMTADEATRWKVAKGATDSPIAALRFVGITDDVEVMVLNSEVDEYSRRLEQKTGAMVKQLTNYFRSMLMLVQEMNSLASAYNAQDRSQADAIKREIGRDAGKLLNAGRQIAKIDKALLAYRLEIPDAALEQIRTDAQLRGRIRKLVETDTAEGYNEAAERLNAVLSAWQELFRQ
ncbi:MAG TPA: hypothetical protein VG711_07180 [Phycisphaerales bacterium]|nr:hypothetical protein [Phycisphaerales bacterium]